jgi:hypothetical protein
MGEWKNLRSEGIVMGRLNSGSDDVTVVVIMIVTGMLVSA